VTCPTRVVNKLSAWGWMSSCHRSDGSLRIANRSPRWLPRRGRPEDDRQRHRQYGIAPFDTAVALYGGIDSCTRRRPNAYGVKSWDARPGGSPNSGISGSATSFHPGNPLDIDRLPELMDNELHGKRYGIVVVGRAKPRAVR